MTLLCHKVHVKTANIRIYLMFLETKIIGLHFAADSMGLSLFIFFLVGSVKLFTSARVTFRPFKVIQGHWFWYPSKARICDFLLVRHSKLGPILHHFRDIAGFCAHYPTPIPTYFGDVPVGLDRADVEVKLSRYLKLFGREIIFEVF